MSATVYETAFSDLRLVSRGKVRDIYDLGDSLLIVTSDRLSAFDVVLPTPIPGKGEVLNRLSGHWFRRTAGIVANHVISDAVEDFPAAARCHADVLRGRSMLVRKARPLPVECIVRGYLAGSGWQEYRERGTVCGIALPPGLRESDRLPAPVFTPSTKAELGAHDENIPFSEVERVVGADVARRVRDLAVAVYERGASEAAARGILIADTKMEFGLLDGQLILIDELLTPDSSRFWRREAYRTGASQESLDKQYVRDYLSGLKWNKRAPGPELPAEVVAETSRRYREILEILTRAS